jgi:hypothetical protein
MQDILCERRCSNKIIDETMSKARKLSREAVEIINTASVKMNEADQQVIAVRAHASTKIREERVFKSTRASTSHKKIQDSLDKHQRKNE